jgi:hypothetical protein
MRIRQIKPSYWDDTRLHHTPGITAEVREFYIGTWQLADDTGWLVWDVSAIAKQLYGWQGVARRERNVQEWGNRLSAIGRLHIFECGHAVVPTLGKHQRIGGNHTDGVYRDHQKCGNPAPSMDKSIPSPNLPQSIPTVSNGKGKGKERVRVDPQTDSSTSGPIPLSAVLNA